MKNTFVEEVKRPRPIRSGVFTKPDLSRWEKQYPNECQKIYDAIENGTDFSELPMRKFVSKFSLTFWKVLFQTNKTIKYCFIGLVAFLFILVLLAVAWTPLAIIFVMAAALGLLPLLIITLLEQWQDKEEAKARIAQRMLRDYSYNDTVSYGSYGSYDSRVMADDYAYACFTLTKDFKNFIAEIEKHRLPDAVDLSLNYRFCQRCYEEKSIIPSYEDCFDIPENVKAYRIYAELVNTLNCNGNAFTFKEKEIIKDRLISLGKEMKERKDAYTVKIRQSEMKKVREKVLKNPIVAETLQSKEPFVIKENEMKKDKDDKNLYENYSFNSDEEK